MINHKNAAQKTALSDKVGAIENVQMLFSTALQHHQNGQLSEAETLYRKILIVQDVHADSLHLLGLIVHQRGEIDVAIDLVKRAIQSNGEMAHYHSNLGNFYNELGNADEALIHYETALRLQPAMADAHNNIGTVYKNRNKFQEAAGYFKKAIELKPDYAVALNNLALTLMAQEQFGQAKIYFEQLLKLTPDVPALYNNLGIICKNLDDPKIAIAHFEKAIALNPHYDEPYNNLANVLLDGEEAEKALQSFDRAIALNPKYAQAHSNRGNALRTLGRLDEAKSAYERAIQMDAHYAEAYNNYGIVLRDLGRHDAALDQSRQALRLKPDYVEALWSEGLLLLLQGKFDGGWQGYEGRFRQKKSTTAMRHYAQPLWRGQPLTGRLLVWGEQGIGDEIMFAGLLPELKKRGIDCVLHCMTRLESLFQRSFPDINVTAALANPLDPALNIVAHCPLGNLAKIFRADMESFKNTVSPYLVADQKRVKQIQAHTPNGQLKIGIAWHTKNKESGRTRSMTLQQLTPLLKQSDIQWVSLQYGDPAVLEAEAKGAGINLFVDPSVDQMKDMESFAAQIAGLDLVITIDNSTAHLAGALGITTWLLLPTAPDWRWLVHRKDSVWYPTLRLFRQSKMGDWASVLSAVQSSLMHLQSGDALETNAEVSTSNIVEIKLSAMDLHAPALRVATPRAIQEKICAVITPIGPGHQDLSKECAATIRRAAEKGLGAFTQIIIMTIDDTQGAIGRSAARNMAIEKALEAGAEWLFFLDADDFMHEDAFIAVAPYLDAYDGVWGQICEIPPHETEARLRAGQAETITSLQTLLTIPPYYSLQMGHFIRANIARSILFDTEMNTGEDFKYYLAAWSDFRCIKTPSVFFINRRGQHSTGPRSANGRMWSETVGKMMAEFSTAKPTIPEWVLRGDYAVIVAHPDDEPLWFGSVLEKARRIVLCYGEYAPRPSFKPSRHAVVAEYPLPNVNFLDLLEPESFAKCDWNTPRLTATGVALTDVAAQKRYDDNFEILVNKIEPLLRDVGYVFTHNPWGEYGHEDHVQVSLAVQEAARRRGCRVLVPVQFAARSTSLMSQTLSMLSSRGLRLPVDAPCALALKQLYQKHGCWTWSASWQPPVDDYFTMLRPEGDQSPLPAEVPLNFLRH